MAPTGSCLRPSSISSKSGSMRWTLTAAAAPQHVIGVSCGHCPGLLVLGLTRQAPGCAALPGRAGPNGRLRCRLEARPKSPILRLSTPRRRRHRDTSPVRRRGRALQPGHARGHRSLNTSGLLLVSTLRFPWTPPLHPPLCTPPLGPHGLEAELFASTQKAAVHAGEAATASVCVAG